MNEKTSLDMIIESLLRVCLNLERDERFYTVSVVYICKVYGLDGAK